MTPIDPRASVLAALHRLAPLRSSLPGAPARAGVSGGPQAAAGVLAQRIAALSRTDPDARRQAVRLVLEAQLAREFGASVLTDAGFPGLLDAVQQQMEGDAQAAAALRALGDWLLAAPA
jgi:hypothetical protein